MDTNCTNRHVSASVLPTRWPLIPVALIALRLVSLAAILSLLAPAVSTITTYSIAVATRHVPRPTTNH